VVVHNDAVEAEAPLRRQHRGVVERLGILGSTPEAEQMRATLEAQRLELVRALAPVADRRRTAGDAADTVKHVVAVHFGEARQGVPVSPSAVSRWIEGQARNVAA
jgi:hypothetical protein